MRALTLLVCIISLTGCSTVRLAIYDYQKKHATAFESSSMSVSSSPVSAESVSSSPVSAESVSSSNASKEKNARRAITEKASKYIGTRYRYGSCDAKQGFDCSGLVYCVAKSQEIVLPRSSHTMAAAGPHIPWKKAEPGDLIFFGDKNRINHVGIVEKNKGDEFWIIHSSSSSGVVREDILLSDYWKKRVMFAIDIVSSKS